MSSNLIQAYSRQKTEAGGMVISSKKINKSAD